MPSQGIFSNIPGRSWISILLGGNLIHQPGDTMHKMILACFAVGRKDAAKALLLAESVRTFAGDFSDIPFLLMMPEGSEQLTKQQDKNAAQLDVQLHSFELDPQAASFPFAGKVLASAAAETQADGTTTQLVWMDTAALVVNSLESLILEPGIRLGCRPVDHLLVGSPFNKPIDPFWEFVYQACGVSEEDIFPMVTSTDQVEMRPYINAGMLVVRPEDRLLRRWSDTFLGTYQDGQLRDFYAEKRLYKIFIHQAILAGCAIASYKGSEIQELPYRINYPLHMHVQYPPDLQPSSMNELVSFRYEGFFSKPDWQELIQVQPPLKDWLEKRERWLARR